MLAERKVTASAVMPGFPLLPWEGEQGSRSRDLAVGHLPILSRDTPCLRCLPETAHGSTGTTELAGETAV